MGGSDNHLPNWYLFTWKEDTGSCLHGRRHSATCGCDEGVEHTCMSVRVDIMEGGGVSCNCVWI